jgi:glycosyltransferase involved in cell wall biosynthesis
MTELSVVVPVYRCEGCLRELHRRLTSAVADVEGDVEFIFVEDRSDDSSWDLLRDLARNDLRVKAYRLSRNFGQHAAITAGLAQSAGRRVVVMDCDLQDPPEEIPRLYAKAQEGYDIVFARRTRKPQSLPRRLLGRAYFRLLHAFTGSTLDGSYGTFSLISRKVVDAFLRLRDRDRHYLFILHWLGFETASVDYVPAERFAGESSYSARALIAHALDGVFFQTTVLLRWIVYLGFALASVGGVGAAYVFILRLTHNAFPGWASVVVLLLVIGGFIIMSTGVTGLYIGRVFDEVRARPLYVIDEAVEGSTVTVAGKRDGQAAR